MIVLKESAGARVRKIAVGALQLGLALGGILILRLESWPGYLTAAVFWALALILLMVSQVRGVPSLLFSIVGAGVAAFSAATVVLAYGDGTRIAIFGPSNAEIAAGMLAIALTLYGSWRCNGPPLALLAMAFLVFAFAGAYLPAGVGHISIDMATLVNHLFISSEGLFGAPLKAVVHILIAFVMLSAFLERSGAAEVIVSVAYRAVGRSTGGPGKVAVVASSLFGTITGAAVANVIASGAFSIPMMLRAGYRREQAAAIESVASTGSQIAPPVLGSAAFIMAELLGVPYLSILGAVTIPAIIYYGTLFFGVHAISALGHTKTIAMDKELQGTRLRDGVLLLPLAVLLLALTVFGFTPSFSGMLAVLSIPLLSMLSSRGFMGFGNIFSALVRTGELIMPLILLTACAGIVIGVFTLTGFGMKMVNIITQLSNGNIAVVMVLTMLASIVLGMGLPTVAVYIVLALTVAPVMVEHGVPIIVAHIFVFYYGALAAITPPVALATIAAASIAEASLWRSGFESVRLAIVAYVLPFMFVAYPGLLLQGGTSELVEAVAVVIPLSSCLVIAAFGYLAGRLNWLARGAFALTALLLITGISELELAGGLAFVALIALAIASARSFRQLLWLEPHAVSDMEGRRD